MKIIDAGQYVSLEGPDAGKVCCKITVRADDGRQISIPTSEDTVNKIIELMAGVVSPEMVSSESLPPVMRPSGVMQSMEESASYFGEDDSSSLGSIAEEPQREEGPPQGLGQTLLDAHGRPIQLRARTVGKDEYGYPIVSQSTEEPPNEVFDEEDPGEQI